MINQLLDFEEKMMSCNTIKEAEAFKTFRKSESLKNEVLDKYRDILKPFLGGETREQVLEAYFILTKIIYPVSSEENWTGFDFLNLQEHEIQVRIKSLDDSFFDYPLLQDIWRMDLSETNIEYISPKVSCLSKLKRLSLMDNQLKKVPNSVFLIKQLEALVLISNKLTTLPDELVNLTNLEQLYICNNYFEYLPKVISALKRLKVLKGSNNKNLHSLPEEIGYLEELSEINFEGCPIKSLPNSFCSLKKLRFINFDDTLLEDIPFENCDFSKVKSIYIRNTPMSPTRKAALVKALGEDIVYI